MNGEPWLTSPVIMTGLWVHAAKLTHWSLSKINNFIWTWWIPLLMNKWHWNTLTFAYLKLKLLIWKIYKSGLKHGNIWLIQSYENPTKSLIMHWTWVKQLKIDGNKLNNTYKSGGKVSKKIELKEHVVVHFPSRPELTINCDGIGD